MRGTDLEHPTPLTVVTSHTLFCSKLNETVTCRIIFDQVTGRYLGVDSCSAHSDREIWRSCRGECLHELNREATAPEELD